jgi:tRNA(Arg) A34 adenosine deaminase TadA
MENVLRVDLHCLIERFAPWRLQDPQHLARLTRSVHQQGQLVPVVAVAQASGEPQRWVLIDGYRRVQALRAVGEELVWVDVWACSGGVPFCALIVDRRTGQVVAKACNHGSANSLFHGEIAAIIDFSTTLQSQGIPFRKVAGHHDLYTTGESCAMCMGAIMWAGFHTVFFGSSIEYLNQYFSQLMITDHALAGLWRDCQAAKNMVRTQIVGGVLQAKNDALFEEFGFQFCPAAAESIKP